MTTQLEYIEKEIHILRENERKINEFCITSSSNIEKLTTNQVHITKRIDEINERLINQEKDISLLKQSEYKRQERSTFIQIVIKLWPLYLGIVIFVFFLGVVINDVSLMKAIFGVSK